MFKGRLGVGVAFAAATTLLLAIAMPVQATQDKTLSLVAVDGSGIGGTVELTDAGDNLIEVVVNATGLSEGESYFSGAYDATSVTCRGGLIGSFAEPVTASSESATISYTVPGPLDDIFSVSVRQGTEPPGTVVACAEDTASESVMTPPATGSGGLLKDEGSSVLSRTAFLAGLVAATAGLGMLWRIWRSAAR